MAKNEEGKNLTSKGTSGWAFSWKKAVRMILISLGLGAIALLAGYWNPSFGYLGRGIFWGLPLGVFNYYVACRSVGFFGTEGGTWRFGVGIGLRWLLALAALYVAAKIGGVWFLMGVLIGIETQLVSQVADAAALILGVARR